jgi:hypothetical protein
MTIPDLGRVVGRLGSALWIAHQILNLTFLILREYGQIKNWATFIKKKQYFIFQTKV